METHLYVSSLKYQYFEKCFEGISFKIKFATTFPQYILKECCSFSSCLGVSNLATAKWCFLAIAKWTTFLQNILWESCSKFNLKKYSLKTFLKILIFWQKDIVMRSYSNQLSQAIKHPFISLYFKYHSPSFICFSCLPPLPQVWTSFTVHHLSFLCQSIDYHP